MPASDPFAAADGGVHVALKVTPKAARDRVLGLRPDADGGTVLAVAVTAAPEDGKANAAVVRLLAREWGLPRSAIRVVAGAGARRKRLHVAGAPDSVLERLANWARALT